MVRLSLENAADLQIYHDGTTNLILTGGPNLKIGTTGETFALFKNNNAVELYYDNSKKFETTSSGTNFTTGTAVFNGPSGSAYTAEIKPINSNPYGLACVENSGANAGYPLFAVTSNVGATYFRTLSGGNTEARTILPVTNNTYNLGSASLRWANLFINDLQLSNKGSSNDVDQT